MNVIIQGEREREKERKKVTVRVKLMTLRQTWVEEKGPLSFPAY